MNTPFYHLVPKGLEENIEYRLQVLGWVKSAPTDAERVRRIDWVSGACRRDPLYFVNVFLWTYDSLRHPTEPDRPFITFPFQDDFIAKIWDSFNGVGKSLGEDQISWCVVKQRDAGGTYCWLAASLHQWQFLRGRTFLVASYKQEIVDTPDDLSALFPKLDYMLRKQPSWLRPLVRRGVERTDMRLVHPDSGNLFKGAATTGQIGRGGRRTGALVDEHGHYEVSEAKEVVASLSSAANSVTYLSTPNGRYNAFGDMAHDPGKRRIDLRWEDDPRKSPGLYTSDLGAGGSYSLRVVDREYGFPDGYPFVLDGKLRSPWFDSKEREIGVRSLVAQEIERSFIGSGNPVVSPEEIERLVREYALPCLHRGDLTHDPVFGKPNGFEDSEGGRLELWTRLDSQGRPPMDGLYVIGADISSGTGASNSCLCVGNALTGEVVGVFVSAHVAPVQLAVLAVSLARWFRGRGNKGAFLVWEGNGPPGRTFCDQVSELGYGYVYRQDQDVTDAGRRATQASSAGWFANKTNRAPLFEEAVRAMGRGQLICRSEQTIKEFGQYQWQGDGSIDHVYSRTEEDPSGAKDNHGDMAVACFLMWHGCRQLVDMKRSTSSGGGRTELEESMDLIRREKRNHDERRLKKRQGWLVGRV